MEIGKENIEFKFNISKKTLFSIKICVHEN